MIHLLTQLTDSLDYYEDLIEHYYIQQIIKGYIPLIITIIVVVAAIFITKYAVKLYAREKMNNIDYDEIVKRAADEVSRRFRSEQQ